MRSAFLLVVAAFAAFGPLAACNSDSGLGSPDLMTVTPPDLGHAPDLVPPVPSDVGSACAGSADCKRGEMCIPEQVGFTGGYCTQDCGRTPCPTGSICTPVPQVGRSFCFKGCSSDGDCREADGYTCQGSLCLPPNMGGSNDGVTPGTRGGAACVTPTVEPAQGTGGVFGPNLKVSIPAAGGAIEAETELAVDAARKRAIVAYIDIRQSGVSNIGVTVSNDDGATFSSPLVLPVDHTVLKNNSQSDPVVAIDSKGTIYISWVGFDRSQQSPNPTNMNIVVARSTDGGVSFDIGFAAPMTEWVTGGFLDKPWLAVSPLDDSVWVTWDRLRSASGPVEIRMSRLVDWQKGFSAPLTISDATRGMADRNLCQIAVGSDGKAHAVWVEIADQQFGSKNNRVYYQRLAPDGTLDGTNVLVSKLSDSPAFDDPSIAVDGARVYVGFISGTPKGDWDVHAAASLDGGNSFGASVKVNDDATCATHFHHQIAVDRSGNVHAAWYDNRYHPKGNVFHAQSPAAGTGAPLAFGTNSFVNDVSFGFTTSRSMSNWIGDYLGLTAVGGEIYACWTDPRTSNVSHVYFARGKAP